MRWIALVACACCVGGLWVAQSGTVPPTLDIAPPLSPSDGDSPPIDDWDIKATVYLFLSVHCPIANSYLAELNRIHEHYAPHGVRVVGVVSGYSVSRAQTLAHTNLKCPPTDRTSTSTSFWRPG